MYDCAYISKYIYIYILYMYIYYMYYIVIYIIYISRVEDLVEDFSVHRRFVRIENITKF